MDKLPKVKSDFSELSRLYYGIFGSRILMNSIGIKIFDHLEQPRSSEQVSNAIKTNPDNTELLLNALSACGLVDKENGLYQNRALASDFLVSGKPTYLGDWYTQADKATLAFLENLPELIKAGPGDVSEDEDMNSEAYCEGFTAAHAATSLGGVAREYARHIAELPGFSNCRTMLDLGGGPGINAMAVVQENPLLHATVFDRPGIVQMADSYIRTYGFQDQVKTTGGNYLADPIKERFDLIMITDTLYYAVGEIEPVLQKCRDALNTGGMLAAIHAVLTEDGTRPVNLVLGLLTETMTGQSTMPQKGFLMGVLEKCGFKDIESKMVKIGGTQMELNVGLG